MAQKRNLQISGEDDVGLHDFVKQVKKEKRDAPEDFVEEYLARKKKKRKVVEEYREFRIN